MKGGLAMRAVMCSVVIGAVSLAVMVPGAMAGTIEIPLRASDVVMSSENPPELILRIPAGQVSGRVDLIRVELVVDANDGEEATFVPFLVSIGSVVPGGPGGYEPSETRPAREMVLGPGAGQTILLDATRALRSAVRENEMYLQLRLVEPVESGRQPGTIGFPLQGGTLGRMLVVTR